MKTFKNIALGALGATVALLALSLASSQTVTSLPAPTDQEAFVNAAESTINGVVSVKSYATPRSSYSDDYYIDPFEYFFGTPSTRRRQKVEEPAEPKQIGLGSGVIISEDGYIVTNNHVIEDAETLEVVLNDNRNFTATVIGTDATTDLALIKIDGEDLHVIPMGNSEDLRIGEWVLAVGNPFGFTSSVTSGIVSAKGRNISSASHSTKKGIESYIQTDAALNAGNSGGALVNLKGELVGINTAIYSQTGNYAGCSFAIPTSIVNKVVNDLMQYGTVQRALLGIGFQELTPELIKENGIVGINSGILVGSVEDRSAAMEAGIEKGDIIVAINGQPTTSTAQIQEALAKCSPGETVTIDFYRDGKKYSNSGTLRNGSGNTSIVRQGTVNDLGATFEKLSTEERQKLGIRYGVKVASVESGSFKDAGVIKGVIILEINGTRVTSPDDVTTIYKAIVKNDTADKVLFIKGIYPDGEPAYYAVQIK